MLDHPNRTVFFVSESTAITSETMGHSLLSQFPHLDFTYLIRPYVNTIEKAQQLVKDIAEVTEQQGFRPLVFATMPEKEINEILEAADCHYYEIFENFLDQIGHDLHAKPKRESGLGHGVVNEKTYDARIEALNFTLKHDDAMVLKTMGDSDVIIVGVSRSGKTPTSLYLALKYGIKASNYPITDSDFEKHELPQVLLENKDKLFATTIQANRLRDIREKRRPSSQYSSLEICKKEIKLAHQLYDKYGISPMDVTHQSIEELSAQIVRKLSEHDSVRINPSKDL